MSMTATAHALIGTILASQIPNPLIAVPIAILSHIPADIIPHWDAGTHEDTKKRSLIRNEAIIDVVLGFFVSYLLAYFLFPETNLIYIFIMINASLLLDWLSAPCYFFKWRIFPFKQVCSFQQAHNHKLDKPWGIITQVIVVVGMLVIAAFV